ncbi:MAG TPA: hypothetical protein PKH33_14335 [bacterium]|nr:hypothetical protein [bacterium]
MTGMLSFNDVRVADLKVSSSDLAAARSSGGSQFYQARVIDFQDGKALLEINGRTVVAESNVPLSLHGEFKLSVKGFDSSGRTVLQVVGAVEEGSSSIRPLSNAMISSRLMGFDLPEHAAAPEAARSLLQYGVPVTKPNMESMLSALPQNASRPIIEFAASLIAENLPLSRELVQLLPSLASQLDSIPADMKSVGDAALRASGALPTDTAATTKISAELAALIAPNGEDPAEIAARLPDFVKAFINSAESRLAALIESGVAPADASASARAALVESLASMLSLVSGSADAVPEHVARALQTLMAKINAAPAPASDPAQTSALETIKSSLSDSMAKALSPDTPPALQAAAVRSAVAMALAQTLASQPQPSAADGATVTLPAPSASLADFAALPASLKNALSLFEQFASQQPPISSPDAARDALPNALARLAPLLNFNFDSTTSPAVKQFVESAAEWARLAAMPDSRNTPELAAATEKLADIVRNPALKMEIDSLDRQLRDLPDFRAALSRAATATQNELPAQALRSLSLSLQSANLANLAHHTGSAPLESHVAFFPIRVDDHVEIGKLKIYRRQDESRDRRPSSPAKPLNPFDARLVLILDTEFLGLTSISLNTFPNKSVKCDIDVQDARRARALEKNADELRDALKNTAYENNSVNIRVRRRKNPAASDPDSPSNDAHNVFSVDMRI